MVYTKYPASVDTSLELPVATDNVTQVRAEVVNRIREAVLAVETELGANPSGTYGTVKDRLDDLSILVDLIRLQLGLQPQGSYENVQIRLADMEARIGQGGGGSGTVGGAAKRRAYNSTAGVTAALATPTIIPLATTSTRFTPTLSTLASNRITAGFDGVFTVAGQASFSVNTDAVSGIVLDVILNGVTTIHTVRDFGGIWGTGIPKTLTFSFLTNLVATDYISFRWTHQGSTASVTTVNTGDTNTWLSLSSL